MCQLDTIFTAQEFPVSGLTVEIKIELIFCFQGPEQYCSKIKIMTKMRVNPKCKTKSIFSPIFLNPGGAFFLLSSSSLYLSSMYIQVYRGSFKQQYFYMRKTMGLGISESKVVYVVVLVTFVLNCFTHFGTDAQSLLQNEGMYFPI